MSEKNLSRRSFMKVALFTATGAAIAAVGPAVPALAQEQSDADDSALTIRDGDDVYEIVVEDVDGVRTVTVTNTSTGEVNRIVHDSNDSSMYSSYTGETITLGNEFDSEEQEGGGARSRTTYSYIRISYAQIKSVTGNVVTVANLTAAILAKATGSTMATVVTHILKAVSRQVVNVISPSTTHGIKARIATTKYYRNGNHVPYRTVKQVVEVSTY